MKTQYTEDQLADAIFAEGEAWAAFFNCSGDYDAIERRHMVMQANVAVGYLNPLLQFLPRD